MGEDYGTSSLPPHIGTLLNSITNTTTNTTSSSSSSSSSFSSSGDGDDLDIFLHCWIQPHCPACLSADNKYPCSWCATSQVCVPNTVYGYPFGILAPLKTDSLCPLGWRERWELRARPFSCRCSSMTFVSVVVAVLATLLSLQLMWLLITLGRRAGRRWRTRQKGWWRLRNWGRGPVWTMRRPPGRDDAAGTQSTQSQNENDGVGGDGDGNRTRTIPQAPRQDDETTPLLA
ncbi:hypothetical protein PV08_02668 [Exophiala spinifera]|uniref:PSI domain-containing protein n=1 Tax=Exophiala spinifera TaxID=91928 RepID=A0A0D2BIF4_9EURO|nr:uncharacterized protein PV08_02668 [Exophiala spinifera]KIW18380.1 hypothetical protein PV08_02668 [Exophiala spinifera]